MLSHLSSTSLQLSSVHEKVSEQSRAAPVWQAPDWHVSLTEQYKPSSHEVPSDKKLFTGQDTLDPVQSSAGSQKPVDALHSVVLGM
jgi:hypothetical protein